MADKPQRAGINLQLFGIVQGVGMRPAISRIAKAFGITGQVRNIGGVVEIRAFGTPSQLQDFTEKIKENAPIPARILESQMQEIPFEDVKDFVIIPSLKGPSALMLPADLPVCPDCQRQLFDEKDRRYRHPFISCMVCGPRYSIVSRAPYDRHNTSMADFPLCEACQAEYENPHDRRYHAQTIACPDCGPKLYFTTPTGSKTQGETALQAAINALCQGQIIAIKGIGGYHLACQPDKANVVQNLRAIKRREQKPFAVMFPDMNALRQSAEVSAHEEALLTDVARPIVLLQSKNTPFCSDLFGGSPYLGAFLPYTPVQMLLLEKTGPLIMTSANLSGAPIATTQEEVMQLFERGLDGVLWHDRAILRGLDDSVVRSLFDKPQFIRRGRGHVPLPMACHLPKDAVNVLGLGGDLKATPAIQNQGFIYPFAPESDVEDVAVYHHYERQLADLPSVLQIQPQLVACDLHPGYLTGQVAEKLCLPIQKIQHHHAHIASVMAEHDLKDCIGVAFDGTGYGRDGSIWGGEFLVCRGKQFERVGCLKPIDMVGADAAMKDAKMSLYAYLFAAGIPHPQTPLEVLAALSSRMTTHRSSSMGRLFDAVCAMLQIWHTNGYEGECGVRMEAAALKALHMGLATYPMDFILAEHQDLRYADATPLFHAMAQAQKQGVPAEVLALSFHEAISRMVTQMCLSLAEQSADNTVALSGGVFQNALLTKLCVLSLQEKGFVVRLNHAVPPNDGGIALGQVWLACQ